MYLVNIRPYIFFGVNTLSQFMLESRKVHWIATKHVLRYLRGTMEYGLRYLRKWSRVVGIYRLIFGRKCSRQKKHLEVLLRLGISNDQSVQ